MDGLQRLSIYPAADSAFHSDSSGAFRQDLHAAQGAANAPYGSIASRNDPNRYGSIASRQFPGLFGPDAPLSSAHTAGIAPSVDGSMQRKPEGPSASDVFAQYHQADYSPNYAAQLMHPGDSQQTDSVLHSLLTGSGETDPRKTIGTF